MAVPDKSNCDPLKHDGWLWVAIANREKKGSGLIVNEA